MRKKKVSFKNSRGLKLTGFLFEPKKYETAVVFCHGFPSTASGGTARRIGPSMARSGYLTLCFNFSHTPGSEGKFEEKLMSREVKDIGSAIDFLKKNYEFKKLILIGHSTGAIDAALYAHSDKRISKLILTGAISDLKNAARYDFTDQQVRNFWMKGYIIYANERGEWTRGLKLKKGFYDEFFTLDIPKAIKKYHRPLLVMNGEADDQEARKLYRLANRPKRLIIIKGAGHSFRKPSEWKKAVAGMKKFIGK